MYFIIHMYVTQASLEINNKWNAYKNTKFQKKKFNSDEEIFVTRRSN